jgi:hypothetical protein
MTAREPCAGTSAIPTLRRRWLLALGTAALTAAPLVGTLGYEGSLVLTAPLAFLALGVGVDAVRTAAPEKTTTTDPLPGPPHDRRLRELAILLAILRSRSCSSPRLWQPNCDPLMGLAYFAMGPALSALLRPRLRPLGRPARHRPPPPDHCSPSSPPSSA